MSRDPQSVFARVPEAVAQAFLRGWDEGECGGNPKARAEYLRIWATFFGELERLMPRSTSRTELRRLREEFLIDAAAAEAEGETP